MLGLQAAFDKEKLLLLFDAANLQEDEIRYRALIGILLTLYTYRKRTALYPQIADRLAALSEGFPNFTKAIRTITLRFILARETEKITRKLQDEIIPEMIKLGPKISQKINLKGYQSGTSRKRDESGVAEYVIEQLLREENGGVQRTATRRRGRNALYFRAPKAFPLFPGTG